VDDPNFDEAPHAWRRGWLKNGNAPGDLSRVARCGARTRGGTSCRSPAMLNGRCRMHGGKATGARTAEGLHRCCIAPLKHGRRSAPIVAQHRQMIADMRALKLKIAELSKEADHVMREADKKGRAGSS
jgi:hypothetical protein